MDNQPIRKATGCLFFYQKLSNVRLHSKSHKKIKVSESPKGLTRVIFGAEQLKKTPCMIRTCLAGVHGLSQNNCSVLIKVLRDHSGGEIGEFSQTVFIR